VATRAAGRKTLADEVRLLSVYLPAVGIPVPEREVRFHPTRRWRFDWSWPDRRLAVEFEGGTFVCGRHTSGKGFENDAEKYDEAALMGWTVLRFTRAMLADGRALHMLRRAFGLAA
jgi:hypothetical protein